MTAGQGQASCSSLRWFFWGDAPLVWSGSCNSEAPSLPLSTGYSPTTRRMAMRSLDPGKATDLEAMWVVDQLYEGLLELDAGLRSSAGLGRGVECVGRRAASMQVPVARLGPVTFHNGKRRSQLRDVAASFRPVARTRDEALPGRWVSGRPAGRRGACEPSVRPDSLPAALEPTPTRSFPGCWPRRKRPVLYSRGDGQDGEPRHRMTWAAAPSRSKGVDSRDGHGACTDIAGQYWMRDGRPGSRLPYIWLALRIEFNREPGALNSWGSGRGDYDFVSGLWTPTGTQAFKREDAGRVGARVGGARIEVLPGCPTSRPTTSGY